MKFPAIMILASALRRNHGQCANRPTSRGTISNFGTELAPLRRAVLPLTLHYAVTFIIMGTARLGRILSPELHR